MRNPFLLVVILFSLLGCSENDKTAKKISGKDHRPEFQKMQWIVGSWKGDAGGGMPFYEAWKKVNDTLLMNYGIEINGTDTTITGITPLSVQEGKIYLGDKDSTAWELSSVSDTSIIFKNDTLKYSNLITWSHTKDDHWFTSLKDKKTTTYDLQRAPALDRWMKNQ